MAKPKRIYKLYSVPRPPDIPGCARAGAWWSWYHEYLRSPEWAEVRKRVLAKARGDCQYCRADFAVEVHHLTYLNVGHECWGDVLAVCLACHRMLHRR